MKKDEEVIKAQMHFLGLIYFKSNGGFNRDEIVGKFKREFRRLKLRPFDVHLARYDEMDVSTISLFAQLGHKLNLPEFNSNIKYYTGELLHDLIQKFLIRRDKNGRVVGTGFLKIVDRDLEFCDYLKSSKVNGIMEQINGIAMKLFQTGIYDNEFGRGANEGYIEWFRKNILKNDGNISYEKLANVFDIIQKRLEMKDGNAIEKMKKFGDGNYDYIFDSLNMSKEVGILFIKMLDYMYAREYKKEMVKKYLEAKEMQAELKGDKKDNELLSIISESCINLENKIRQLRRFRKCKSEQKLHNELNRYVIDSDDKETGEFETVKTMLERADSKRDGKLEIADIKDLQRNIASIVFDNAIIDGTKTSIVNIKRKVKNIFQLKTDKNKESKEGMPMEEQPTHKIKRPSLANSEAKRFSTRKDGKGLTNIINRKIRNIAYNMGFFIQDTFSNIKLTMGDASSEVGGTVDNIKSKFKDHERELKSTAVIAALAALGISTSFFVKHCINKNVQEASAIEKIVEEGYKENEQPEIDENVYSEELQKQEREETGKVIEQQEESSISNYFKNGISLKKGDRIYRTSYRTESSIAEIAYAYDNLCCDLVSVIKDNEIIQNGTLENIDELYKIGIEKSADVMLRTGIMNEDGTMTYIAWCNLNEMIDSSERNTEEQKNYGEELLQEDDER